ncbi:MAG: CPBP family intramembrane glutamic endopeptidase [Gemmataceae bacterium]
MKSLSRYHVGYWQATQHPLVCVVFVAPLLIAYEIGTWLSGPESVARNGADVWLRETLASLGARAPWTAPALLVAILLGWGLWRRRRLPPDLVGASLGMTLEAALFAVGLFGLSQAMAPLIENLGWRPGPAALGSRHDAILHGPALLLTLDPACQQIVRYLGAGLYEETLFRLLLFSGLWGLFLFWDLPPTMAFLLAGLASALSFAGAHHVGPHGEPFQPLIFSFRTMAGLYFGWVFHFRGFGIAVGAHAGYDVLVGILAA